MLKPNPHSKGTAQKPLTPGYFASIIRRKMKKDRVKEGIERKLGYVGFAKLLGWKRDRGLHGQESYNWFLKKPLSFFTGGGCSGIVDALSRMAGKSGGALDILDDGAGTGRAMEELRGVLSKKGITSRITALALEPDKELARRHREGKIDEVAIGPAEKFTPGREYDAIFSLYGSINYVADAFKREHALKMAHSLRKGGLMMAVVDLSVPPIPTPYTRRQHESALNRKPLTDLKFLETVKNQFKKYGFRAEFYPLDRESKIFCLLVQRER